MWEAEDDNLEARTSASRFSGPKPGFSLDDAFSEDDGILDAELEFNPAAIRAALARTLATGEFESTEDQNGADGDKRSTDAGISNRNPAHDRNGSVGLEDPDASVSTLDINGSPVHASRRAPEQWSRSTSHSYGYRQHGQDATQGMESLEDFSQISLSDSVSDFQSVEISLGPSEEELAHEKGEEGDTEEDDDGVFHAVHIDLSQGGKPRVEEVAAVLPVPPSPRTPERDGMQTPSPKHQPPPPLPSTSNYNHNTYTQPPTSTPTSKTFSNHQSQSRSVPELPSPNTYRRPAEDTDARNDTNHIPPDSAGTALSPSSLVSASSATTTGSIPTPNSTGSPPNSSQSESFRRGHRSSRSVGPSTLDKVISKTRPTYLPPKPKTEDLKHMADWETMMKQSRAVGEFRFCSSACFLCCFFTLRGIQVY